MGGREGGRKGKWEERRKKKIKVFFNSLHEEYKLLIICNSASLRNEQVIKYFRVPSLKEKINPAPSSKNK